MGAYIIVGALAAFGLVCAVWVLCGLLLEKEKDGLTFYSGPDSVGAARRYLWLREMGLAGGRFLVLDPPDTDREWLLERNIEICGRENLASLLGIGAESN